jgi:hypothetical protein
VLEQVEEPQAAVRPLMGSVDTSSPTRAESERQARWAAAAMTQTREQLKEKFRQKANREESRSLTAMECREQSRAHLREKIQARSKLFTRRVRPDGQ